MSTPFLIVSSEPGFPAWAEYEADNENQIDFRNDPAAARRCTLGYCAAELKRCLTPALSAPPQFAEALPDSASGLELVVSSDALGDGGFTWQLLAPQHLRIIGNDRNGLVNGVYEFLRLQGWRWYRPGAEGEYAPPAGQPLRWPQADRTVKPSCRFRGICVECASRESRDFLIWMARNRLNVYRAMPGTTALAHKFGMWFWEFTHADAMLYPDRRLPDGRRLFDAHQDWFGTGLATDPTAQGHVQMCMTNQELMDFLLQDLLRHLRTDWAQVDILSFAGFDNWQNSCQCPRCLKFGTSTDTYAYFVGQMQQRLDAAHLPHPVILDLAAYEGTVSLAAPRRELPAILTRAPADCQFFVINRCYRHALDDPHCAVNAAYAEALRGWAKLSNQISLWSGEYYNVSRHEDLPLLFNRNLIQSMKLYHECGATGATFMHIAVTHWGMRALTWLLHAQLAWQVDEDPLPLIQELYSRVFGKHAAAVQKAYADIEEASLDVAEWRAWGHSILAQLATFDGIHAPKALEFRHYANEEEAARKGHHIAALYRRALERLQPVLKAPDTRDDARREEWLLSDRLLLRYGADTAELSALLVSFYHAVRNHRSTAAKREILNRIFTVADQLENQFIPARFCDAGPGFSVPDALTRTQYRPLVNRLRKLFPEKMTGAAKAAGISQK